MATPLVLFDNFYDRSGATLTATSEASGFPIENVADWRQGTAYRWKSTSTSVTQELTVDLGSGNDDTADTVALAGHNLSTVGAGYRVFSSDDDISYSAETSEVTPTDDLPTLTTFTASGAHRYWRVNITSPTWSAVPQVGIICLGPRLDFEVGAQMDLDPYHDDPETEWSMSHNGSPIGGNLRYLRKRFRIAYEPPGMTKTGFFAPSSGLTFDDDFIPHARSKPFFFAWNTDVDADEVYVCRRVAPISMPFYGSTSRRGLFTEFEAWREAS